MFTIALFLLFIFVTCICLYGHEKTNAVRYTYIGIGLLLFCFSAFKPLGIDDDSMNYVSYYYGINNEVLEQGMEITFKGIIGLAHAIGGGPRTLFIAYALLSVPLRAYAIVKNTDLWMISVLMWMSNFYVLQDMTQIRIAVAAGIYLIGVAFLTKGQRREYLLMAVLATCFHYSAAVLLFLVFFGSKRLNKIWLYILAAMPILGYAIYFSRIDIVTMLPIPFLQDRMNVYLELRDKGIFGDAPNVFNAVYVLKFVAFYLMLWKHRLIEQHAPNFPLLMKLLAISYFCFTAFAILPVLSFRLSELIGTVEIILLPYLAYTVKPLSYGKCITVLFALGNFMLNIFYNHLIKIM